MNDAQEAVRRQLDRDFQPRIDERPRGVPLEACASSLELRRWAESKGANVRRNGPLPNWLILAWNKAHPDRPYDKRAITHGSSTAYTHAGCRCATCRDAQHERYTSHKDGAK